MDRKKLDALRAKYGNDAPASSHHPEFKQAIETIFAGTDRRPKPYEGVATFLPCGKVNDALLKLTEARQPREEAGCAEMRGAAMTCA